MLAERGTLVVVHLEPVGHVDLEALLVDLRHQKERKKKQRTTVTMIIKPRVKNTKLKGGI